MDSYYLYQRQYRENGGAWKNTSIYSVDGWQTQEKVVAQIDPSECDEWNPNNECKVTLTLEDCTEVCIPCDGSRTVTRADLGEYANRAIIAEFGCCIDTIDGVFQGDTKIKKVIIPDCITAITEASFYGTDIEGLVIPASVTYIGSQTNKLAGLKWARFMGTIPPTLAAQCSLGGNCPIYVPPAYVNVYKTATVWSNYANRIQPWQGQVETDYEVACTPPPTPDTGETGTTYETWIEDGTGFTCVGTDKYHIEYAWTSSTGSEGSYVKTNQSRTGNLWETGSTDCGYVPPTPSPKFTMTLTGGTTVSAECDSSSAVTSAETSQYSASTLSVTFGDCVLSAANRSFSDFTALTGVTFGGYMTTIGNFTFSGCNSLSSVTVPDNITAISPYAFYECSALTAVTIGTGITSIGNYAFSNNSALQSVTISATTPPNLAADAFYNTNCTIYVPAASVDAYKAATNWSVYADRIQAIST